MYVYTYIQNRQNECKFIDESHHKTANIYHLCRLDEVHLVPFFKSFSELVAWHFSSECSVQSQEFSYTVLVFSSRGLIFVHCVFQTNSRVFLFAIL